MNQKKYAVIYDYLYKTIHQNGYPPTLHEIALGCDLDISLVADLLNWLEHKQFITRIPNKTRGIRLIELDREWYCEDQIAKFSQAYIKERQTLPSITEIAEGCHFTEAVVRDCIARQQAQTKLVGHSLLSFLAIAS